MTKKPAPDVVAPSAWHFEQQFPPDEDFVPCLAKQEPDVNSIHIRNVMPLYSKAALQARPDVRTHDDTLEEAAKVCERLAQEFLSPQYSMGQPLSSFQERFACAQCAEAIRNLKGKDRI